MRFRSVLLLLLPAILLWVPAASAQKRVFATVNPNADVYNGTADLYDPQTGAVTPLSQRMNVTREQHVAVRLASGKVLIAGGYNNHHLRDAEIFNPADGSFTVTDNMLSTRSGAAGVLMSNGVAFIAGGYNGTYLKTVETYEPATAAFTLLSKQMTIARQNPAVLMLNDTSILITGGFNGAFLKNAEIYDPINREFTQTTELMEEPREGHTATLLTDGKVLITGGCNNSLSSEIICDTYLSSAEIFNPDGDTFTKTTGLMTIGRKNHTATLLPNGKVLIVGGINGSTYLNTAEIYDPATGTFTPTGNLSAARAFHTASILSDGKVLIAGGKSDQYLDSVEIYDPATGTFSTASTGMSAPRMNHSATVLSNGKVLLAGGRNTDPLIFDVNSQSLSDNIAPNIVFSTDSQTGFVSYTGSGTVLAFSPQTGAAIRRIATGGKPYYLIPTLDKQNLVTVSVQDNKIFVINISNPSSPSVHTYTCDGCVFGFGSIPELSPQGDKIYVSSTSTGEVIQFDLASRTITGRLKGLSGPAQITLTKDGSTLLIVDTVANTVAIAKASTMAVSAKFKPLTRYAITSFSIFNKVILNSDESMALIGSQDSGSASTTLSGGLLFNPSTGAWILDEDDDDDDGDDDDIDEDEADDGVYGIGYQPGYSLLTPDGKYWLTLTQNYLSRIPTEDPRVDTSSEINDQKLNDDEYASNFSIGNGAPLGSSNLVLSADGKYVYYAVATTDRVIQQDISKGSVVGSFPVGDELNLSADQASRIGITPDGQVLAALLFASNELDLLTDSAFFRQTKYVSKQDEFTGLSIINLSNSTAKVIITAMTNSGGEYDTDTDDTVDEGDIVNPATVTLAPNAQKSIDVSELFNLDNTLENVGYLTIESAQPILVGHTAVGQIQGSFLNSYISNMEGIPVYSSYRETLHDFILPEIPEATDATTELNFLNPNYNNSTYDLTHYSPEGTEIEVKEDQSITASNRSTSALSSVVTSTLKGQVMFAGGYAANKTLRAAELFDANALSFTTSIGAPKTARQGHAATLLTNGKVLVTGGKNGFTILKSSELYNPAATRFSYAPGTMTVERYRHTATRLGSGKVLLAGGQNSLSINQTAELYDPVDDRFVAVAAAMKEPRDAHTATRLSDGKVLLVGGLDGRGTSATAEIYNPADGSFTYTNGPLNVARAFHTAVPLGNGKVLIAGGYNGSYLDSAELYDPQTGLFTLLGASMTDARSHHTATLLSDGTVLIAGGMNSTTTETGGLNTAEIYDPATNLFARTNNTMYAYRTNHTATNLLNDENSTNDKVLVAGGYGYNSVICVDDYDDDADCDDDGVDDADEETLETLSSADIYNPETGLFSKSSSTLSTARQGQTAVLLDEGIQSGYLRIESDNGLLATEVYSNGGAKTAINAIDVDKHVGVKSIYSPRFVISSGRLTLLNVINANDDSAAAVTVTLHASDGTILTKTQTLAVNAQWKGNLWDIFDNQSGLQNQQGWLEVTSSVDRIVGTVSFTNSSDKYLATFELSGTPMTHFVFPLVSEDSDYETEISLLNSGNTSATVSLELWGPDGVQDGATVQLSLAGQTHISKTLHEIFSGMQNHRYAYIRVLSSQPIYGTGELRYQNLRFISSVAPVAYPE